jgi:hypothetical protein
MRLGQLQDALLRMRGSCWDQDAYGKMTIENAVGFFEKEGLSVA